MTKKLFKTLSYILHPVFMPVFGVLILFSISHLALLPIESKKAILFLVAIVTVFFPLALIPILYFQKAITGVNISSQRERIIPMFLTSLFYYFGYYILHKYSAPLFLQQYMLAIFVSVLAASIINIGWKISLHMVGIGGIIGLLSAITHLFGIPTNQFLMLAILLAGIIGTARLYLNEHTSTQIYSGFMMGYVINFGIIVLFNS